MARNQQLQRGPTPPANWTRPTPRATSRARRPSRQRRALARRLESCLGPSPSSGAAAPTTQAQTTARNRRSARVSEDRGAALFEDRFHPRRIDQLAAWQRRGNERVASSTQNQKASEPFQIPRRSLASPAGFENGAGGLQPFGITGFCWRIRGSRAHKRGPDRCPWAIGGQSAGPGRDGARRRPGQGDSRGPVDGRRPARSRTPGAPRGTRSRRRSGLRPAPTRAVGWIRQRAASREVANRPFVTEPTESCVGSLSAS